MNVSFSLFLSALLFCAFSSLFFQESLALEAIKEKTSTKALGMGNAYSAIVEDADAFFYNPSQISNFKKIKWNIVHLNLGSSTSFFSSFNTVLDSESLESQEKFSDLINSFYSNSFEGHAQGRISLEMPYFMFLFSIDGVAHFIPMDPPFPILDTHMYIDRTYGIGVGFPLSPTIDIGGVFKQVQRDGITEKLGPERLISLDFETIEEEVRKTGSAYLFDLAASFNPDVYPSPTFSLIWKNPLNTKFKSKNEKTLPPSNYGSQLIAGAGAKFNFRLFNIKPALDIKHILNTDLQWTKKIHLGVQFEAPLITLRTGLNQGYLTAGGTLSLLYGLIEVDGAYYKQELGEYTGQFGEQRFELSIKLAISTGELATNQFKKGSQQFFRGVKKVWRRLKKRRY